MKMARGNLMPMTLQLWRTDIVQLPTTPDYIKYVCCNGNDCAVVYNLTSAYDIYAMYEDMVVWRLYWRHLSTESWAYEPAYMTHISIDVCHTSIQSVITEKWPTMTVTSMF